MIQYNTQSILLISKFSLARTTIRIICLEDKDQTSWHSLK